jgi:NitT/TauT family transport system substrate-binding protein
MRFSQSMKAAGNSCYDELKTAIAPSPLAQTMSKKHTTDRRRFLIDAAAASASLALAPVSVFARGQRTRFAVRVASNQGTENATLQQLLLNQGYASALSLDAKIVESRSISAPMEALLSGEADVCMVSGFVGVLPAIEQGKQLRLVGAAMLLPALAVYARSEDIRRVEHLVGRTVGVGAMNGLLHVLMLALLRKKGIDSSKVTFVNAGSNAQVLDAVESGKVAAGLSGVAGMSDASAARMLEDGQLWQELPEYTYQPAYASVRALEEKPDALARCLAAYTKLYRYLSGPGSKAAYLAARRSAASESSTAEGEAVWNFIQKYQPYALDVGLSPERIAYLQELNVAVGLQSKVLPFERVVDLSPARGAKKFLG